MKHLSIFVVIALLAVGCNQATNTQGTENNPSTAQTNSGSSTATPVDPVETSYTMAQVAQANSASKCYSAVNGMVYDLTAWIGLHPGGEAKILAICGKDGSSAFNNQHEGQAKPEATIGKYKIGTLKN